MKQFTREETLKFANIWKQFHDAGKHKSKIKTGTTVGYRADGTYGSMEFKYRESDLEFIHHIIYNYVRNLPLSRGIKPVADDPEYKFLKRRIADNLWGLRNAKRVLDSMPVPRTGIMGLLDSKEKSNYDFYKKKYEEALERFTKVFGNEMTVDLLLELYDTVS